MLETLGWKTRSSSVAIGPPWATCFVEVWQAGRSVLEEWVLRDERGNVPAFCEWRQSGSPALSIRCEAQPPRSDLTCLECVAHQKSSSSHDLHLPDGTEARIVSTFAGLQQCLADAAGGLRFCKSGLVFVDL